MRIIIFILFFPIASQSQNIADLTQVDSFAAAVRYKNLNNLTLALTGPYSEELHKARAIFKWITENISYDYKYYNKYYLINKEPKTYSCISDKNCEAKKIVWEMKYINRILRKKKAVCYGYSLLFKKMCEIAGLKSEVIPGYARTEHYQVGTPGRPDHAWNAVWIDSAWYLLDATWAAGSCAKTEEGKLLSYHKKFENYYWLTPAADFARNHFPQNQNWTQLPNYTKDSFSYNPYYHPGMISNLRLIEPKAGIITAKKGDTIHFKIGYTGYFQDLQINSNLFRNPDIWVVDAISKRKNIRRFDSLALKKQQYISHVLNGSVYEFQYVVTGNSLYYLDIIFDRQRVMRFKVNMDKRNL